jgi:hypothetical protein
MKYLHSEVIYDKHIYLISYLLKEQFHEHKEFDFIESNFKKLNIVRPTISETDFYNNKPTVHIFESDITDKLSIYNNFEKINLKDLASLLKRHNKFYMYEHYFVWFKDYFQHYLKSINTLFHGNGYLPITWRYYIAIMSVSSMRSDYLLKILEENFVEMGGDESWLIHGLDVVPEKIVRLGRINNILAHQPWILNVDDIKEINTDKEQKDHSYWNVNELMHAVLIMIHFHKISIIVESMRFNFKNKEYNETSNHEDKIICNLKDKLIEKLEHSYNETDDDNLSALTENDLEFTDFVKLCFSDSKFKKHINSFCNVYHDFDPHSEEYRSYLVIIYNTGIQLARSRLLHT